MALLNLELDLARSLPLLEQFFGIVPWQVWESRIQELTKRGRALGDFGLLLGQFELEFAMAEVIRFKDRHHALPGLPRTPSELLLLSFIKMACCRFG
jgi:hypothetical protein